MFFHGQTHGTGALSEVTGGKHDVSPFRQRSKTRVFLCLDHSPYFRFFLFLWILGYTMRKSLFFDPSSAFYGISAFFSTVLLLPMFSATTNNVVFTYDTNGNCKAALP